ncbi:MAG TPA: NAD(P)H-dependent glycerol-3-phosphate dehydrogenase, partial [Burkholderiaceae bacterium]|nr:NAD(P)H-dependent glycerol-3-phosphate dehydrogenase [Burkholderiaceae bacterium]
CLWEPDAPRLARMQQERENATLLPGIKFPPNVSTCDDLATLVKSTPQILIAVPSHAFYSTVSAIAPHVSPTAVIASATKGLEPGTGRPLADVALEILGNDAALAVISGPTFAKEVALGLPTAFTVAATKPAAAETVATWLRGERTRVYINSDLAGVQLGGAIKNVIAIAAGISDGLGFGANARAALITRGLAELTRLGVAMGGKKETFMGLTGAGDLILTCTDNLSRNRRLGLGLGQGRKLAQVMAEIGQEVEGVATARELHQLASRLKVDMPITEQVYCVLFEHLPPQAAVEALLRREPRAE